MSFKLGVIRKKMLVSCFFMVLSVHTTIIKRVSECLILFSQMFWF